MSPIIVIGILVMLILMGLHPVVAVIAVTLITGYLFGRKVR